jgi:uncharacterized protein (DUF302 family)
MMNYGFSKTISIPYEEAIEKVTTELKKEGFGVLTTIDVKETLKKKIDVDFKRYIILGACNPSLAHKALQTEEQLGLLLPCNVIVYEEEDKIVVAVFDPMTITRLTDNKELMPIAEEVKLRMKRVLEAI